MCTRTAVLRRGFTIVEALVATMIMGVAGGMLAAAFTVTTAARRRAALDVQSAVQAHERIALLSHRPCVAPDTSGSGSHGAALTWWRAARVPAGWSFSDSVSLPGVPPRPASSGVVACL
jgi:type II secretory pathway pseudopilin PulG